MNHGLILEPIVEEDFIFGSDQSLSTKFGATPLLPSGDWRPVLFDGIFSHQAPNYETQSCVSHGTLNALELLYKKQYDRTYDFSDRFLAKMSGTDPNAGNSPKTVAHTFYKQFAAFESEWATSQAKTTDEFYADIPLNLITLSTGRGAEWNVGYEYVGTSKATLKEALKYSPIGISVPGWHLKDGVYYRPPGATDNHWVCLLHIDDKGQYHILDSYDPFTKILSPDINPTVAMRYHLTRQISNENAWNKFLVFLHRVFFNV